MTLSTPQKEIEAIVASVSRLGGIAEFLMSDAISAVVRRDTGLAHEVIDRDQKADAAHRDIERQVMRFLALRQPIATDLRQALAALKIAGDLERVGDLAKNIAKRTLALNLAEPVAVTRGIERMGRIGLIQLKQVLDAYAAGDVTNAVAVWVQDEDIDAHYNSLFRELLTYMMEDPRTISSCAHLLFVAKNLERIGDHCTNIAETIHFLVTGAEIENERPKGDDTTASEDL